MSYDMFILSKMKLTNSLNIKIKEKRKIKLNINLTDMVR